MSDSEDEELMQLNCFYQEEQNYERIEHSMINEVLKTCKSHSFNVNKQSLLNRYKHQLISLGLEDKENRLETKFQSLLS
jgi:hypothetical protein